MIVVRIEYLMGVTSQVFEQLLTVLFAKTKESYDSSGSLEALKKNTVENNGWLGGINQNLKAKCENIRLSLQLKKELISCTYRKKTKTRIKSRAKKKKK